jgi:hypothetical protein
MENDIAHSLDQDLNIFKKEITELLEEEILGRYFYEDGAIAWTIKNDEQVNKALEILNDKEKYSSILSVKTGSTLSTSKGENYFIRNKISVKSVSVKPV